MIKVIFGAAFSLAVSTAASSAAIVTLDFEGLQNLESVNGFYNGGTGSLGSSGTDYGVEFSSNTLGATSVLAGGSGAFANEPSPQTVMFSDNGAAATLTMAGGFEDGFSFYYASPYILPVGFVDVYDGLDGTGNLLASLELPVTGTTSESQNLTPFDIWAPIGVTFTGTAKSINFGGDLGLLAFDNITFGSDTPTASPVPIPAALPLLVGALGALGLMRRRAA